MFGHQLGIKQHFVQFILAEIEFHRQLKRILLIVRLIADEFVKKHVVLSLLICCTPLIR